MDKDISMSMGGEPANTHTLSLFHSEPVPSQPLPCQPESNTMRRGTNASPPGPHCDIAHPSITSYRMHVHTYCTYIQYDLESCINTPSGVTGPATARRRRQQRDETMRLLLFREQSYPFQEGPRAHTARQPNRPGFIH